MVKNIDSWAPRMTTPYSSASESLRTHLGSHSRIPFQRTSVGWRKGWERHVNNIEAVGKIWGKKFHCDLLWHSLKNFLKVFLWHYFIWPQNGPWSNQLAGSNDSLDFWSEEKWSESLHNYMCYVYYGVRRGTKGAESSTRFNIDWALTLTACVSNM